MRTCQSCGLENPDDRDFCSCGEYLRWEPTGVMQAVTPEIAAAAAASPAAPPEAPAAPPEPAAPAEAEPPGEPLPPEPPPRPAAAPAPAAEGPSGTMRQPSAAPPPSAADAPEPAPLAAITLRLPGDDDTREEQLAVGVDAGGRERVLALIRNQSQIVDNYVLSLRGLPDSWWTIAPAVAYLVPFGSGGTYEQEIEIHIHPPRSAEAEARLWDVALVAHSKAHEVDAAVAPFVLGIQPYEEIATKVTPERASGRFKARFDVAVENKANAPARVAFSATEPDNECRFTFDPPHAEIAPGEKAKSRMTVRPPKQIWLGRSLERRLQVNTNTGEEATEEAAKAEKDGDGWGLLDDIAGKAGVQKPAFRGPSVGLGPGGVKLNEGAVRGPKLRQPRVPSKNLRLDQLKMPSRGPAPPAPAGPLLPTQAIFRQKAWLPWWLAIVLPLILLLAAMLFLLLPKNVTVPEVVGKPSAFEAEQSITDAGLRLAADVKTKVDPKAAAGSVLEQTPPPGETAEKDTEVSILVATGDGKLTVPNVVGKTAPEAEKLLRDEGLSLGQATPQPLDLKAKIESQIPAAKEIVEEGKPVDIFLAVPKEKGAGGAAGGADGKDEEGGGKGGEDGKGGGEAAEIVIPAVDGQKPDAYAKKVGDLKLIPKVRKAFNDAEKGTIFRVNPEPGTKAKEGDTVTLFVSAGIPQVAFDNGKDVLRANGSNGAPLDPIAKGTQIEDDPTFSPDGESVAFTSDGQVFVRDLAKQDAAPVALTQKGERFSDLSWAPTGDQNVLALIKREGDDAATAKTSLCFGTIDQDGMETRCRPPAPNLLGRKINWSANGKTLLVWGATPDFTQFGMIRYTNKEPFSADPNKWQSKGFATDTTQPGQGALDAVPSPDGKELAVVSLGRSGRAELFVTTRQDFLLQDAKRLGVGACKAVWRPDGKEILVVRADNCLNSVTGNLVRVPRKTPKDQRSLRLDGDNPAFQPLTVE